MAIVGRATILIAPSLAGFNKSISNQVNKTMPAAGRTAGTAMAGGMAAGVARGSSTVAGAARGVGAAAGAATAGAGSAAGTGFIGRAAATVRRGGAAVTGAARTAMAGAAAAGATAGTATGTGFVGGLTRAMAPLAAIFGGAAIVGGGFSRLANIEDAEAQLTGLGHSAETVTQIMDDALTSVKGTAFGLDEAATLSATLVASGIKPGQELAGVLRGVADAATIGGTSLSDMGSIYSQVAAGGKVQADDLNQLTDRGIPALQLLSEHLGVSVQDVREMVSAGEVGFADFAAAMDSGMAGAALKSGETTRGTLANVGAAVSRLGASIMEELFPKIKEWGDTAISVIDETVIPAFQGAVQWVKDNSGWLTPMAAGIGAMVAAWGAYQAMMAIVRGVTVAYTAVQAALNAVMAMNPIGIVVLAIVGLVAAFVTAYKQSETFRNIVTGAWNGIKAAAEAVWNFLRDVVFGGLMSAISAVGTWFSDRFMEIQGAWNRLQVMFQAGWLYIQAKVFNPLKLGIQLVKDWIGARVEDIKGIWNGLQGAFRAVWDWISANVFAPYKRGLDTLAGWVRSGVGGITKAWEALKAGFAAPINWVINTVWNGGLKKAFDSVSKAVGSKARLPRVPNIATRATGGPVRPGQPYLVGEEGPELITPGRSGWVHRAAETRSMFNKRLQTGEPPHGAGFWDNVGGVVSGIGRGIGSAASAAVSWVRGGLASAAAALLDPIKRLIGSTVGRWGSMGEQAGGVATNAIDSVVKWIRGKDEEETGGPNTAPTARGRLRGAKSYVNNSAWGLADMVGGIRTMQAFNQSMAGGHPKGLAVDFIDSAGKLNRLADAIIESKGFGGFNYMAWNGRTWKPGRGWAPQTVGYGNDPYHRWHVHGEWYDDGGMLKPGMSMVGNATGRPEPVLTGRQWSDIHQLAVGTGGSGELTINVNATSDDLALQIGRQTARRVGDVMNSMRSAVSV